MKTFGEWLKATRTKMKITQTAIAHNIGVSQNAMSHYELGRSTPTYKTGIAIAKFLRADLNEVLMLLPPPGPNDTEGHVVENRNLMAKTSVVLKMPFLLKYAIEKELEGDLTGKTVEQFILERIIPGLELRIQEVRNEHTESESGSSEGTQERRSATVKPGSGLADVLRHRAV